ncbi:MAG: ATP-binding protein [Bacteroidota bacterium]
MSLSKASIVFCVSFWILVSCMTAQSLDRLPKLLPSYSENFSDYNTFPSVCFSNAYIAQDGRLWLTTCGTAGQYRIHLFQFDGYEFKVVKGAAEELPTSVSFNLKTPDDKLVGIMLEADTSKMVILDLITNQLSKYELPEKTEDYHFFLSSTQQLMLYCRSQKALTQYIWQEDQFVKTTQLKLPDHLVDRKFNISYASEQEAWLLNFKEGQLYRADIKQDRFVKIEHDFLEFQNTPQESFPYRINLAFVGQHLYLKHLSREKRKSLFRWDEARKQFEPVKGLGQGYNYVNVFSDKKGNLVYAFKQQPDMPLQAILEDKNGRRFDYSAFTKNLNNSTASRLIGTDFKKELIVCNNSGIELYRVANSEAIETTLYGNSIRSIIEFEENKIYVKTQNLQEGILLNLNNFQSDISTFGCESSWRGLVRDGQDNFWSISTSESISRFSIAGNSCETFLLNSVIGLLVPMDEDRLIYIDSDENNQESLWQFNMKSKNASPILINGQPALSEGFIQQILYSKKNKTIYVATSEGLHQYDLKNQTQQTLGYEAPFLDPRFLCIFEAPDGKILAGTPLGGLYIIDPITEEVQVLNSKNGLCNNTVAAITMDDDGDFWVGTYNGIGLVSSEGALITNLYAEDGLANREANRYAAQKLSDGKILMGTVDGLNIIDPQLIKSGITKNEELKIYLTSIEYFDQSNNALKRREYGLNDLKTIILPAASRDLQLSFATSNYYKPLKNQYAYRLRSIDDDWTPIGNQHTLSLNNLPAGKYDVEVIGSDDKGNWTGAPLIISLDAKEYFYKKKRFIALCIALVIVLSILWIQRLRSEVSKATKTIREDKETIERQTEELKELDKAKSRFFTNISHEFRTPLTIISGMVDQVKNKPDIWLDRGTDSIKQNTLNLLNLVNQILDLRKLESSKMSLNLIQGDIVKYLQYLSESYDSFTENAGLQLHFLALQSSIMMDYDPEKILRIVSNLLSNAIKYNKEGGHIYFQVTRQAAQNTESNELVIRIRDTGDGIPEEKLKDIFGRYFQANEPGEKKVMGSGIGLALANEMANLMGGRITVQSSIGEGTTFKVVLPITNRAAVIESTTVSTSPLLEQAAAISSGNIKKTVAPGSANNLSPSGSATVLIVEDNPQIQQILMASLEDKYKLLLAKNGQEGIDVAIEEIPDLILSDVMMSRKNGYELTDYLKNDERTNHIPIVLLTAKSDLESKIEGLEKGADAYLSKPFEPRELHVRFEKLLELRQKLQARYSNLATTAQPKKIEDPFLQKVYAFVEKNISNPELDMNKMSRHLGMSRSQVFRKLKALTGKSASLMIRSIRLQKGKELLETSDMTISEIAFAVGFTSLNYFSSAFYEEFGTRPSTIRS